MRRTGKKSTNATGKKAMPCIALTLFAGWRLCLIRPTKQSVGPVSGSATGRLPDGGFALSGLQNSP